MENYSVLMSVYHKEVPEYLRQSIDSMLNQTVLCEQFVIVKDGPLTEELDAVIDEYVGAHPSLFTVVPLPENVGLAKALNAGIEQCRNDLIARMDADDISLPQRCERQLALFEKEPRLGLSGTNIDEFYDDPSNVVSRRVVPSDYEEICKFIRRRSPFNHPTVMYRKKEVLRCGPYGDMRRAEDYDLFSHMINMGVYAQNIDESLLLYRADESNYERRKGWASTKARISAQVAHYKKGYCSFWDLIVVTGGQMALYLSPMGLTKWLSDTFLRKKPISK